MATACSSLSCLVVFVVNQGNHPFKWQQRTIPDPSRFPTSLSPVAVSSSVSCLVHQSSPPSDPTTFTKHNPSSKLTFVQS